MKATKSMIPEPTERDPFSLREMWRQHTGEEFIMPTREEYEVMNSLVNDPAYQAKVDQIRQEEEQRRSAEGSVPKPIAAAW